MHAGKNSQAIFEHRSGFTIVELLIVIVVIAILATLSIVSYTGIQNNARTASLKSDLSQSAKALDIYKYLNSEVYPSNLTIATTATSASGAGIKATDNNSFQYSASTASGSLATYCLTTTNSSSSISYHIATGGTPTEGPCNGQTGTAPSNLSCPTGYITVPGNSLFGTSSFCVMKYEAKNVGGVATSQASDAPWVPISQTSAISTSTAACSGCHLITEPEWLTIAHNVLNVASNWSGGTVGSGYIYSGHNDSSPNNPLAADPTGNDGYYGTGNVAPSNQRRTLTLSNGQVIWDLAGNVWNWTAGTSTTGQPGSSGLNWRQWNALTTPGSFATTMPSYGTPAASGWTSTQGIGRIFSNSDETALRGFRRGGPWDSVGYAGVLTLNLYYAPSSSYFVIGFRVSR